MDRRGEARGGAAGQGGATQERQGGDRGGWEWDGRLGVGRLG